MPDVSVLSLTLSMICPQEEREKKRIAELDRKAELRALAENEVEQFTPKATPQKVTAYQLQVRLATLEINVHVIR